MNLLDVLKSNVTNFSAEIHNSGKELQQVICGGRITSIFNTGSIFDSDKNVVYVTVDDTLGEITLLIPELIWQKYDVQKNDIIVADGMLYKLKSEYPFSVYEESEINYEPYKVLTKDIKIINNEKTNAPIIDDITIDQIFNESFNDLLHTEQMGQFTNVHSKPFKTASDESAEIYKAYEKDEWEHIIDKIDEKKIIDFNLLEKIEEIPDVLLSEEEEETAIKIGLQELNLLEDYVWNIFKELQFKLEKSYIVYPEFMRDKVRSLKVKLEEEIEKEIADTKKVLIGELQNISDVKDDVDKYFKYEEKRSQLLQAILEHYNR